MQGSAELIGRCCKELSALHRLMTQDFIKFIISCIINGICCCDRQERSRGSQSNKSELCPLHCRLCLTQVLNTSSNPPALLWVAKMGPTGTAKPCTGFCWQLFSYKYPQEKGCYKGGRAYTPLDVFFPSLVQQMPFSEEQDVTYMQRTKLNPSLLHAPTACTAGCFKNSLPSAEELPEHKQLCCVLFLRWLNNCTDIALRRAHKAKLPSLSSEPQGTLQGCTQQNTTPFAYQDRQLLSPQTTERELHCIIDTAHTACRPCPFLPVGASSSLLANEDLG